MKILFVFIFLGTLCPLVIDNDDNSEDLLIWDKCTKLTWADFKGRVNDSIMIKQYGIKPKAVSYIGYVFEEFEVDDKFNWRIETYFDRAASFSVSKQDSFLLQHEQCHFDIFELIARKMRKSLREFETSNRSGFKDDGQVIDYWNTQCDSLNNVFDFETFYGALLEVQREWELRIEKELNELKDFEAKTFYSSFPSDSR